MSEIISGGILLVVWLSDILGETASGSDHSAAVTGASDFWLIALWSHGGTHGHHIFTSGGEGRVVTIGSVLTGNFL
jgi:hypothetical protein